MALPSVVCHGTNLALTPNHAFLWFRTMHDAANNCRTGAKQGAKLSDWLMVAVTAFAALAAGGSFWAALRQEQATFTNTLYTKQVDSLGTVFADATRLEREIQSSFAMTDREQLVQSFLRENIPAVLRNTLNSMDSRIASISHDFESAKKTASLVLPTILSERLDRINSSGIAEGIHILRLVIVDGQGRENASTLIPAEIDRVLNERKILNTESEFLFACVHDTLLDGRPILNADAQKCEGSRKRD